MNYCDWDLGKWVRLRFAYKLSLLSYRSYFFSLFLAYFSYSTLFSQFSTIISYNPLYLAKSASNPLLCPWKTSFCSLSLQCSCELCCYAIFNAVLICLIFFFNLSMDLSLLLDFTGDQFINIYRLPCYLPLKYYFGIVMSF